MVTVLAMTIYGVLVFFASMGVNAMWGQTAQWMTLPLFVGLGFVIGVAAGFIDWRIKND